MSAADGKRVRIADAYGRILNNIRISVTAECNYRCIFCHIEGEPLRGPVKPGTLSAQIMSSDYRVISRAAWALGVDKIKLTGGEPLLRTDIHEIVASILEGNPKCEVSMTTNGYLLESKASQLADAGLNRVNVSIHSLRPGIYEFITGVPGLERAIRGVNAAIDSGLGVKINSVILKGVNEGEIWDLISLAEEYGITLQLIELHPVGLGAKFFKKYFYPLSTIEKEFIEKGARVERRSLHNRPIYILPSGARVEIVRPYANPLFCAGCTRIRIGPFGDLSPCLNWRGPRPSILPILRSALSEREKALEVAKAIARLVLERKPYYMWNLSMENGVPRRTRISRLTIPRRSSLSVVERELARLLAVE